MLKTAPDRSADNVDQLIRFTELARERGMEFATIRQLLLSAGWKDATWPLQDTDLESITIHNRDDCCQSRARNLQLKVFGDTAETQLLFDEQLLAGAKQLRL